VSTIPSSPTAYSSAPAAHPSSSCPALTSLPSALSDTNSHKSVAQYIYYRNSVYIGLLRKCAGGRSSNEGTSIRKVAGDIEIKRRLLLLKRPRVLAKLSFLSLPLFFRSPQRRPTLFPQRLLLPPLAFPACLCPRAHLVGDEPRARGQGFLACGRQRGERAAPWGGEDLRQAGWRGYHRDTVIAPPPCLAQIGTADPGDMRLQISIGMPNFGMPNFDSVNLCTTRVSRPPTSLRAHSPLCRIEWHRGTE
jgi:hypothetical protein